MSCQVSCDDHGGDEVITVDCEPNCGPDVINGDRCPDPIVEFSQVTMSYGGYMTNTPTSGRRGNSFTIGGRAFGGSNSVFIAELTWDFAPGYFGYNQYSSATAPSINMAYATSESDQDGVNSIDLQAQFYCGGGWSERISADTVDVSMRRSTEDYTTKYKSSFKDQYLLANESYYCPEKRITMTSSHILTHHVSGGINASAFTAHTGISLSEETTISEMFLQPKGEGVRIFRARFYDHYRVYTHGYNWLGQPSENNNIGTLSLMRYQYYAEPLHCQAGTK